MKNDDEKAAEKIADGKKAGKLAAKKQAKNKLKKAAEKAILEIAAEMPAGKSTFFLSCIDKLDKLDKEKEVVAAKIRGVRAEMKSQKIELGPVDFLRKLRKMDIVDAKSFFASFRNYCAELQFEIFHDSKEFLESQRKAAEAATESLNELHGITAGREIGSSAAQVDETEEEEDMPAKNESFVVGAVSSAMAH